MSPSAVAQTLAVSIFGHLLRYYAINPRLRSVLIRVHDTRLEFEGQESHSPLNATYGISLLGEVSRVISLLFSAREPLNRAPCHSCLPDSIHSFFAPGITQFIAFRRNNYFETVIIFIYEHHRLHAR